MSKFPVDAPVQEVVTIDHAQSSNHKEFNPSKELRKRLKLKPHTRVAVEASDDDPVLLPVRDGQMRGLGKELADGTDAGDYVKRLRQEWEQRS